MWLNKMTSTLHLEKKGLSLKSSVSKFYKSGCPSSVSSEITLNAYSSCSWQSITIFHPLTFIIFHCFTLHTFYLAPSKSEGERERGREGGREGGYRPVCVINVHNYFTFVLCIWFFSWGNAECVRLSSFLQLVLNKTYLTKKKKKEKKRGKGTSKSLL